MSSVAATVAAVARTSSSHGYTNKAATPVLTARLVQSGLWLQPTEEERRSVRGGWPPVERRTIARLRNVGPCLTRHWPSAGAYRQGKRQPAAASAIPAMRPAATEPETTATINLDASASGARAGHSETPQWLTADGPEQASERARAQAPAWPARPSRPPRPSAEQRPLRTPTRLA